MRLPTAAALLILASAAALTGCAHTVENADTAPGWAYRQGSALELVVHTSTPSAAPDGGAPIVGTWTGNGDFAAPPAYSQRYYALEVRNDATGGGARRTEVKSLDNMDGLPPPENEYDERRVYFRLKRDAGVLVFDGEKNGKQGSGDLRFEKDADYAAVVSAVAGRDASIPELVSIALANVPRTDIEDLRSASVTMEPSDLIRMRDAGISGKFLHDLNQGDRRFSLDDAIKLHNAGVPADFIKELRDAGLSASVPDMIRLRDNGVSSRFVKDLADAQGRLPSIDEIVRLRNSGVSARYIAELRAAGYNFTTADFVRLNQDSISAAYARGMKEAGYDFGVEELVRLRDNSVSSQYVKDLNEPGYTKLSIDQIIEAKRKGVSADFVRTLRKHQ